MNDLIIINYEKPTVSGRELHAALGVETDYRNWFSRMCEYGFIERKDFQTILTESTGGRPSADHERFGTVNSYPLTAWEDLLGGAVHG